jgi:hypothetical protein
MSWLRRMAALSPWLAVIAVPAHAECGCEVALRPCVERTLATVPVVMQAPAAATNELVHAMDFSVQHCWGCSREGDFTGALFVALVLFTMIQLWKRFRGSNTLSVARLDRLGGSAERAGTPDRLF